MMHSGRAVLRAVRACVACDAPEDLSVASNCRWVLLMLLLRLCCGRSKTWKQLQAGRRPAATQALAGELLGYSKPAEHWVTSFDNHKIKVRA